MRTTRTLIICLLAVFALSAIAASGASAAPPEFSKICYKVEEGTGEYPTESACVKEEKKGEKPKEWDRIEFTSEGGEAKLKIKNLALTVTCESSYDRGTITGKKTGTVEVRFKKCSAAGHECQNQGAGTEEIKTSLLFMKLGFIKGVAPVEVGVSLEPAEGELLAEFTCAIGEGEVVKVRGSVIGKITPINMLTNKFTLEFIEAGGEQVPTKFEGKAKDTLEASLGGGVFMPATEVTTDIITLDNLAETEIVA